MSNPDHDRVASSWAARGFSCDLWTDPPGQRWRNVTHATDELVMVLEGQMEFEISGKVHHPRPGEELLIPAGAVHSTHNLGASMARWLYGYKNR